MPAGCSISSTRAHKAALVGGPAAQPVDIAALTLGRPARPAITDGNEGCLFPRRQGRGAIVYREGCRRCTDALGQELLDDEDAVEACDPDAQLIADPHGLCGLRAIASDVNMPRTARRSGCGSGFVDPDCPEPGIHSNGVGHTVDSLAARAAWVAITAPTAMSPCPSV